MSIIYPKESYSIIGCCYEVFNNLGQGFLEIVYKDALEYEFYKKSIPFEREVKYEIPYKSTILKHKFFADFVVYDKIILEIKAVSGITDPFIAQTLYYLKASENKLGLLVNFGGESIEFKRVVL